MKWPWPARSGAEYLRVGCGLAGSAYTHIVEMQKIFVFVSLVFVGAYVAGWQVDNRFSNRLLRERGVWCGVDLGVGLTAKCRAFHQHSTLSLAGSHSIRYLRPLMSSSVCVDHLDANIADR